MKLTKILLLVLSLNVMYQFASAQNCPGNKVLMSKGYKGACGCNNCQKKCVLPGEVQSYINMGWYIGECINVGRLCCGGWVRNSKTAENIETMLTNIYSDPASRNFTISFNLQKPGNVNLRVFDMSGRYIATVANKTFEKDHNDIYWDAGKLNTGLYYLKMSAGEYSVNRKISVIN